MAQQDAAEIGDELDGDDYTPTYKTLETLRDDERLTKDQQSVLNEAHAIVQEFQRHFGRDDQRDESVTLDAEGYREKRDSLIREVVAEGIKVHNSDGKGVFAVVAGEPFEATDGAFYISHPVGIIEHCEQSPEGSLCEHAKWVKTNEELIRLYAHDLLAQAVEEALADLIEGEEVAGIRIETDAENDRMEMVEC